MDRIDARVTRGWVPCCACLSYRAFSRSGFERISLDNRTMASAVFSESQGERSFTFECDAPIRRHGGGASTLTAVYHLLSVVCANWLMIRCRIFIPLAFIIFVHTTNHVQFYTRNQETIILVDAIWQRHQRNWDVP